MDAGGAIITALGAAGYRVTEPRRAIAELIASRRGHFTSLELESAAQARRVEVSRATLFRALDLLVELGMIERLDLPSGEHAYVSCAQSHHHHLICSRCGRSDDVEDAGLGEAIASIALRSGYRIDTHRLELFGLCQACQADSMSPA